MSLFLTLPPTPKPARTLDEFQQAVAVWTRQAEQAIRGVNLHASSGPSGIPEAPIDGTLYGRKNATWVAAQPAGSYLTDAPSDGSTYARKNGSWVTVTSPATGNLTEATSSVLTITGGTNAVIGTGTTIQVKQSSGSQSGYLSSTDWTTFNNKANAFSTGNLTELTSSVLTIGGGTGSVIGSGTTITVTKSDATHSGYLSSADWSTFNSKQAAITWHDVTAGSSKISLGGTPTGSVFSAFSIDVVEANLTLGNQGGKGNLTEATSSVLTITGGTNAVIGTGTTIQVKQASGSQSGYLSSTDWTTFNSKANAFSTGNLTETGSSILTITGGTGAVIGSGTTIQVTQADTTHSGFLTSTDWNTFNNKLSKRGRVIVFCAGYTPVVTGADVAEFVMPYDTDGTTSVTWNIVRLVVRVQTAGGAPSVTYEKSTGSGGFSATTISTVTLSSGASEGTATSSLGTINSGDKARFNVAALGTAQNWTVQMEISK